FRAPSRSTSRPATGPATSPTTPNPVSNSPRADDPRPNSSRARVAARNASPARHNPVSPAIPANRNTTGCHNARNPPNAPAPPPPARRAAGSRDSAGGEAIGEAAEEGTTFGPVRGGSSASSPAARAEPANAYRQSAPAAS